MAKVTKKPPDRSKAIERVKSKIVPASEISSHFRALIYGRAGAQKTRTAATAPKVLVIDVNEKGQDSVRRDHNPDVYPVEFWQEINDVYWYLQNGDHDYKSFSLDSVTNMQTLCMKWVLGDEASRDASKDPNIPSKVVWNKTTELMKTQIINFRNLKMNGIFLARQRTRVETGEDEDDAITYIQPNMSPAILDYMEGAVPLIGHITNREVVVKAKRNGKIVKRKVTRARMLVAPSERYSTKDRYGVFGDYVDNPNLTEMIEKAYGPEED